MHQGSSSGRAALELQLLGCFQLRSGDSTIQLPHSAQRLLAFLALRPGWKRRVHVAGMLWLDSPEHRAAANLRSAVWRANQAGARLVDGNAGYIQLNPAVRVDLHDAARLAHSMLDGLGSQFGLAHAEWTALARELLPDWDDDWVLVEREHHRHLGLEALEALSERLLADGYTGKALEIGLAVVAQEPLRESAHRLLVKVFLAEGNSFEAIRQYRLYERLARRHLGLAPSDLMERLVGGLQLAAS